MVLWLCDASSLSEDQAGQTGKSKASFVLMLLKNHRMSLHMHRVDLCWEIVQQDDSDWLDSVSDCDSLENACNCAERHYCLMFHHLFDYPFYFANLFIEFQMNSLQEPRRELKSGCHERKSSEYVWGKTRVLRKDSYISMCVHAFLVMFTLEQSV